MLNFIICDDEEYIRKNVLKIISKLMMPLEAEYKTYEFINYNKDFDSLIRKKIGKKIYILDIEVNNKSGLDVARKIRERDWESIIIILTAHYELAHEAFKSRLMLLSFVSKFDNYEQNICEDLKLAINISNLKSTITFYSNKNLYKIDPADVLYIIKSDLERKIIIKTFYSEFKVTKTLNEIIKDLDGKFIKTHRACIVNTRNIKSIDYRNNIITFSNNDKINLLSRNYKKEVKEYAIR
jgi:two-component system, LytTR family, response regulator AgrA